MRPVAGLCSDSVSVGDCAVCVWRASLNYKLGLGFPVYLEIDVLLDFEN